MASVVQAGLPEIITLEINLYPLMKNGEHILIHKTWKLICDIPLGEDAERFACLFERWNTYEYLKSIESKHTCMWKNVEHMFAITLNGSTCYDAEDKSRILLFRIRSVITGYINAMMRSLCFTPMSIVRVPVERLTIGDEIYRSIPRHIRDEIRTCVILSNGRGGHANSLSRLPKEVLYYMFSHLVISV